SENDLCLAGVFGGKVLLVGARGCRALALADGAEAWKAEAGEPSGLGVASGDLYYLPLKDAVAAIDLEKGTVVARAALKGKGPPGNLVLHGGMVLAQSATAVTAYPQAEK